jgi:hypothetical protein
MRSTAAPLPDTISTSAEWMRLTEVQQIELARAALQVCIRSLAEQAEILAREMDAGCLLDRGGPDALRLLAKVMRASSQDIDPPLPPGLDLASMKVTGRA